MSVLIKNMEMPKNCTECDIRSYDANAGEEYCPFSQIECLSLGRQSDCPLVELPEKHGRLIDENDVIDAIHDRLHELQTHKEFIKKNGHIDLLGVIPYIAKVQSVIEVEGEE